MIVFLNPYRHQNQEKRILLTGFSPLFIIIFGLFLLLCVHAYGLLVSCYSFSLWPCSCLSSLISSFLFFLSYFVYFFVIYCYLGWNPFFSLLSISHREKGEISVYNTGKGIPVQIHAREGVYVPELIFGHLLTSSNYNDEEKKVIAEIHSAIPFK